jgi:hypothetical protein
MINDANSMNRLSAESLLLAERSELIRPRVFALRVYPKWVKSSKQGLLVLLRSVLPHMKNTIKLEVAEDF